MNPATAPDVPTAALLVAAVRVQDFRVLRDVCVELDRDTTVLLGENNTGKSAFLLALDRALGGSRSTEDDLHVAADGTRASRFVIDVRIEPATGDDFDDDLTTLFGTAVQAPDTSGRPFVTLRTIADPSPDGSGLNHRRQFVQGWSCDRQSAMDFAGVPGERVDQTRLGLLAFTLLDASRDLVEELRRRTSNWGRLLADLDIPADVRAQLESQLAETGQAIIDGSAVLSDVQGALQRLTDAFASGADDVHIAPLPPRIEELARGMDVVVTAPGSAPLPLRHQGSGGRSLTSLMVFRAFIDMRMGRGLELRPLPVSAFEEPEAHLHPHAQQVAFRQLRDMPGQKIVSTHSAHTAPHADLRALRMFRRDGASVDVRALALDCPDETVVNLRRYILRRTPEALFARLVILVEGETEEAALPVLASAYWADREPAGLGLSFVSVDGAQNFANVAEGLEALGLPWVVLADGDRAGGEGVSALGKRMGRDVVSEPWNARLLPDAMDFEQYLMASGCREPAESAITEVHGARALQDHRENRDGKKNRRGELRDFTSEGWEERLVIDYLKSNKGVLGGVVAEYIVRAARTLPVIDQLFQRAEHVLRGEP